MLKRIILLCDAFIPEHYGGISKSILNEIKGFKKKGIKVILITRKLRRGSEMHDEYMGISVYRYKAPYKGTFLYRTYPLFSYFNSIKKFVNYNRDGTVFYVHDIFQAFTLLKRFKNLPIAVRFHAPLSQEIEFESEFSEKYGFLRFMSKSIVKAIRKIEKKVISDSKCTIVSSDFIKKAVQEIKHDSQGIIKIPLCVDTDFFSFNDNPLKNRDKLNLPKEKKILLTVRRLVARMGLDELILAFKKVTEKRKDVILLIGGKGYLENKLKNMVHRLKLESCVKFLGFIREEELPSYYQSANFFVLPTKKLEGFGMATIEAMSCGTPVIATPEGANKEIIGGVNEKFLSNDNSYSSLAKTILDSLKICEGEYLNIRKKVRRYCVENFSKEKVTSQLIVAFASLIKEFRCNKR